MKILDIQDINNDFDEFALAKTDIEKFWKLDNKLSLIDFINKLNLKDKIFMYNLDNVIPFEYIKTNKDSYLFICKNSKDSDNAIYNLSKTIIESNYDLTEILREINSMELVEQEKTMPDYPFFIIKNKYYTYF